MLRGVLCSDVVDALSGMLGCCVFRVSLSGGGVVVVCEVV